MLEKETFLKMCKSMPIPCVDLLLYSKDDEIALVKRNHNNLSMKDRWATPGGRICRDEKINEAAHRIALREVGINVPVRRFVREGVEEVFAKEEHAITNVLSAQVPTQRLRIDGTSSVAGWFRMDNLPLLTNHYKKIVLDFKGKQWK